MAKCRLTTPVFAQQITGSSTSGHKRSAGCSSGLYGGRKASVIPSGTASPLGPCQPRRLPLRGNAEVVQHAGSAKPGGDVPLAACSCLLCEAGEQLLEQRLAQAVGEKPDRLARTGLHERAHVQPLLAVMAQRDGALADRRPHTAADRLQAETMLVLGPDLNRQAGVCVFGARDRCLKPPLNAARCSGVAERGWRGRGAWMDQRTRLSASQPRSGTSLLVPWVHPLHAELASHPKCHLGPGPAAPAILGRRAQPLGKRLQHGCGQHARGTSVVPPPVPARRVAIAEGDPPEGRTAKPS